MVSEIERSGRVSLIDLSDIIGVDLYHIEKLAQKIMSYDSGLMLIQGEVISEAYWRSVAEEINEKLEECSHIALAEIAAQYHVSSELVLSVLEPFLGTTVSFECLSSFHLFLKVSVFILKTSDTLNEDKIFY